MANRNESTRHFYQLVYMSVRRMGEQANIFGQDVRNILATARSFNRQVGIGGALLFNGTFFAQVLEGNREEILSLMERIVRDPRHTHVSVVEEGWVTERAFPDWAMAFADDTLFGRLPIPSEFDPRSLNQVCTRPAIIEAMQYLIGDEPDPQGSDGPGS